MIEGLLSMVITYKDVIAIKPSPSIDRGTRPNTNGTTLHLPIRPTTHGCGSALLLVYLMSMGGGGHSLVTRLPPSLIKNTRVHIDSKTLK